jgi:hypothetical protein
VVETFSPLLSSALELESGYSNEVVSSHREQELSADSHRSSEPCLAHARHRLGPAEDFFDTLPFALSHPVSTATGRSAIQNRRDAFLLAT